MPAGKKKQKAWVVVLRAILAAIIALATIGGVLLSAATQAYSLPTGASGAFGGAGPAYDTRPQDLIEGRPLDDFRAETDDFPQVLADYAGVCTKEGRILFERDADVKVPMASTTKMMTAIIAIETTPLDTMMTVTYGAAMTVGTSAGLQEGMTLNMRDLLYCLMVPSGNDAAVCIAENISGMESRFVALMNEKAASLGMTSTHYADSSGLSDEDHYTTVRDYLRLARYTMANPIFREVVSTRHLTLDVGGVILDLESTNLLFDVMDSAEVTGVKTGFIDESGYCFVGSAIKNGIELYSVTFHGADGDERFRDAKSLLEWGFRHFRTIELINSRQLVGKVALTSWPDKLAEAYAPLAIRVQIFDLNGAITQDVSLRDLDGAVGEGQECGTVVWLQGGEVIASSPVVTVESVAAPDFFQGLSIWWGRVIGAILGQPAHLEGSVNLSPVVPVPAAA
jgi:D-alanyl-D-alanine carboxypeptidase (penicillin-binding protein 5/6)